MIVHFRTFFIIGVLLTAPFAAVAKDTGTDVKMIASAIRYEATLPNNSEVGRPLPLAAHWNSGEYPDGFDPDYQLEMIAKGHYLLPWFHLPPPTKAALNYGYYRQPLERMAQLNLPISFISTQWERILTDSPRYLARKAKENPNVVNLQGKVEKRVSPFGPPPAWQEAGKAWTDREIVQRFQTWYPQPPLVLFISNNEHRKLQWHEVEESSRYQNSPQAPLNDQQKRQVVGDAWISRYRALQQGMQNGLKIQGWKKAALFVGYNAFGLRALGRWNNWNKYSLHVPGRMEPWPLAWDGASAPYYVSDWNSGTDFTVMSPQIEAMNWVFMQEGAYQLNPGFWFEMSTWDGQTPNKPKDKKKYYTNLGQTYGPDRYEGFVQFGMWLLRPRVVREFRNHLAKTKDFEPYFLAVVKAVDRVHNNETLRRFWRQGKLIKNLDSKHPYQSNVPEEYQSVGRWFLLNTNYDPQPPWALSTTMPVYAIARVIGRAPVREWLVFAHSPLSNLNNVHIKVPEYKNIKVNTNPAGSFFYVIESTETVRKI